MANLDKNNVSLAGEFAVLSQLALRGFDANLTLGRTKGVDILASDPRTGRMFRVEVKTAYGARPAHSALFGHTLAWVMNVKHERIADPDLFYCFVTIEPHADAFAYRFFVVPSALVADYTARTHPYWLRHSPHLTEKAMDTPVR